MVMGECQAIIEEEPKQEIVALIKSILKYKSI